MKQLMKSFHIWKMTAAKEKNEIVYQTSNGLDIQYRHAEDTLVVTLKGRLDTLSAPELMELLDRLGGEVPFHTLVIDLEELEYLSSTGLRVFLMMAKRLGSDHLFVDNANALVREIFKTTGFADVIVIR
jgi:anti-sigma B factor antagonist